MKAWREQYGDERAATEAVQVAKGYRHFTQEFKDSAVRGVRASASKSWKAAAFFAQDHL